MWTHPRDTIRQLLGNSPLYVELLLVGGSGVVQSIIQAMSNQVGTKVPGPTILLAVLVVGTLWGLFQLHVVAVPLYFIGRWTGAPASFADLRTALAWAAIPQVAILPFWILGTLVFGRFLYIDAARVMTSMPIAALAQGLLSLATLVCVCWWIVLQVFGLAEAQHVSAWRALGHLLAAGVMLGVAVLLIVMVFIIRA